MDSTSSHINIPTDKPILLFDGVCNLCTGLVQFVIKRDPKAKVRFTALQSEVGQQILKELGRAPDDLDTALYYFKGKAYERSDMSMQLFRNMSGLWPLLSIFQIVPTPIRNAVYNWVATNRYKWFGKSDHCMMPTPELKARFL